MPSHKHLRPRQILAEAQAWLCPACELPLPANLSEAEVDHIIPISRGGPDLRWNRRILHKRCNRAKGSTIIPLALALAAEHGVTITEPLPRPYPRCMFGHTVLGDWVSRR